MKEVTKLLINDFKIEELSYDFMGYSIQKDTSLTFHHLILSREFCKKIDVGKGYWYENGCVLCENSHQYLHLIERYMPELFFYISSELIDMKVKKRLDIHNLIAIHQMLEYFENLAKESGEIDE